MKLKAETIDLTLSLHITQRFVIQRQIPHQQVQDKGLPSLSSAEQRFKCRLETLFSDSLHHSSKPRPPAYAPAHSF